MYGRGSEIRTHDTDFKDQCLRPLGDAPINIFMFETFSPNYDSHYKKFAGQTVHWVSGDSEELYQKNLLTKYNLLEQHGWLGQTFTYSFNSLGFRCREFNNKPSLMTLGCSHTMGIGLPVDKIWPELLASKLNLQCANFGQAGASLDTAFRLCHGYIDRIQPQLVVLMTPPGERFEQISTDRIVNVNVQHDQWANFYREWCPDQNHYFFNYHKNTTAIAAMCQARSIKFLIVDTMLFLPKKLLARDLLHFGIDAHQKVVEKILQLV